MTTRLILALLIFAAPTLAIASPNRVDGLTPYEDSGVTYVAYSTLQAQLKSLEARFPKMAKYVVYGKTLGGLNLNALRIESADADLSRAGRLAVEISGAIHGNEYLGIEQDLAVHFLEHPESMPGLRAFLAAGGVIYLVPVVNPDGYASRVRGNRHGKDLNRDWDVPPISKRLFNEPESRALADFLDGEVTSRHLKLRFSMDYHCCLGAMITPWTYIDAYPRQDDLRAFNEIAQLQKNHLGFPTGNAADTVGYNAVGGTLDYYFSRYGTTAFTIEGAHGGEVSNFAKHAAFFDEVFQRLALESLGI